MPKKVLLQSHTHVITSHQIPQEVDQTQQLPVFVEVVVGQNRNAVLRLRHQRKSRVVYQNCILETSIHATKVFGIKPLLEGAMLPV